MAEIDKIYDEAMTLKASGQLDAAIAKWQEGIALDPAHGLTHSALAVHLQRAGRPKEAVEHAKKVTELAPNDPFSFTQLSVICQRCGLIPEAEEAMARAQMLSGHHHKH